MTRHFTTDRYEYETREIIVACKHCLLARTGTTAEIEDAGWILTDCGEYCPDHVPYLSADVAKLQELSQRANAAACEYWEKHTDETYDAWMSIEAEIAAFKTRKIGVETVKEVPLCA